MLRKPIQYQLPHAASTVGKLLTIIGNFGLLEIAVNAGSAEDNFQGQPAAHFPKNHHQVQGSLMYQSRPQEGSQFQKAVFLKVSL